MIKYLKSRTMAFTLISFLISLVLAGIIIAAAGYSPVEAYSAMLGGAFGSTYNLAQTAGTAIPLIFAGLAMAGNKQICMIYPVHDNIVPVLKINGFRGKEFCNWHILYTFFPVLPNIPRNHLIHMLVQRLHRTGSPVQDMVKHFHTGLRIMLRDNHLIAAL